MKDGRLDLEIIGAAIGCGAQDQRTELAADWLKDRGLSATLQKKGIPNRYQEIVRAAKSGALKEAMPSVAQFSQNLAQLTRKTIQDHRFPLVLGGDHSCAVGTWSGVKSALKGELGLIWLDAHMDAHTPETSETGAIHGMPVASLLGCGDSRLCDVEGLGPKLLAKNIVLIGIRSYERGEEKLLQELGVRVMLMNEVETRGFQKCFEEALAIVTENTSAFGISLDLDGIDPIEVPAVGSPVPNGFHVSDVKQALALANSMDEFVALEIAEYNPMKDLNFKSYYALIEIIEAARIRPALSVQDSRSKNFAG